MSAFAHANIRRAQRPSIVCMQRMNSGPKLPASKQSFRVGSCNIKSKENGQRVGGTYHCRRRAGEQHRIEVSVCVRTPKFKGVSGSAEAEQAPLLL